MITELQINTKIGKLTGIFEAFEIDNFQTIYTAYFKEHPEVIVEASNINFAILELLISLDVYLDLQGELLLQTILNK